METAPGNDLDLTTLRPKGHLTLRLMFDGAWTVLTVAGAIFALVGLVTVFVAAHLISLERRYEREGKVVQGTVESKDHYTTRSRSRRGHSRTHHHYRVAYAFQAADGQTHKGKGEIARSLWNRLGRGSTIDVQYLPAKPSKNRPASAKSGALVWLFVLFPVGFGGAGLVMLAIVRRRAARHAGLLSNGTLTKGAVEEKKVRRDITINRRHPYDIHYTFALPDGTLQTGKDLILDAKLTDRLEPGDAVGVIYLPADPQQSSLFREKWMKHFQTSG